MATSAGVQDETQVGPGAAKAPGVPLVPLVLAVVVAALLAVAVAGGAVYWLAHTGRLAALGLSKGGAQPTIVVVAPPPAKSHPVVLDPLLVNLADSSGTAYLRVSLTLKVLDDIPVKGEKSKEEAKPEKGAKAVNENEAAVRDVALDVIGRTTAPALLELEGKEKLKQQLLEAIAHRVPELKVKEIFFTEFLVQQ